MFEGFMALLVHEPRKPFPLSCTAFWGRFSLEGTEEVDVVKVYALGRLRFGKPDDGSM